MKYLNYRSDDFARDEYFKSWVIAPDPESVSFWQAFLDNHPHKRDEIEQAKTLVSTLYFPSPSLPELTEEDKSTLFTKIVQDSSSQQIKSSKKHSRNAYIWPFSGWLKAVAILSIAMLLGTYWYTRYSKDNSEVEAVASSITKETLPGQKITVALPDGSVVKLNAASKITYYSDYLKQRRLVLEGEAFFDVAKNPENPFVVTAGQLTTQVLGTSFKIRHDSFEEVIQVAVLSGKVQVYGTENPSQDQILEPDQMATADMNASEILVSDYDYDLEFGWKDNLLVLRNASFQEIIKGLKQWYGVDFTVLADIDQEKDFSASYRNKSLEVVLEGLSFTFGFEYEIKNNEVIIN